jgi:hypothetical protein
VGRLLFAHRIACNAMIFRDMLESVQQPPIIGVIPVSLAIPERLDIQPWAETGIKSHGLADGKRLSVSTSLDNPHYQREKPWITNIRKAECQH